MFDQNKLQKHAAGMRRLASKFGASRRRFMLAALCAVAAAPSYAAWPERPITLIVPFTAGGSTDVLARLLGKAMQTTLGQTIIVENRVGAAGSIGAQYVAKAAPDGYTLVFGGVGTNIVNSLTVPETPYNPQRDFAPVGLVCTVDYVLVVNAASPIKTFQDFISRAKQSKRSVSYMSTGNKGPLHVGMEYLSQKADVELVHVPYRGENAALPDLLASRIDVAMMTVPFTAQSIKEGKMRAIANIGSQRSAMLPDVATVAEQGFPGYALPIWVGISAPAGTPADRIELLNKAMKAALGTEEVKQRMLTLGVTPIGSSATEFKDFMERERARWVTMIKETGALDK